MFVLPGLTSTHFSPFDGTSAMPRTATARNTQPHSTSPELTPAERGLLLRLQRQALLYFVENQVPHGFILDRQSNHGPRRAHGLCSMAATGMGFIALSLAAAPPYRLLSPPVAALRIRVGLRAVLERLPHDHGAMPHFVHSATSEVHGSDYFSTVETAWLAAGALWAAAFLRDSGLEALALRLYERIDWHYWTAPETGGSPLLRHGKDRHGRFLPYSWDRMNGETVFMYVLAAGAWEGKAVSPRCWEAFRPFTGTVAGLRFDHADLGLFVFQYGLDLLDLARWRLPQKADLWDQARLATQANEQACREKSDRFATYRRFWGLSAGDGPGDPPAPDSYRCYSPVESVDGTAHLTATLAAVAHRCGSVLENVRQAQHECGSSPCGRYGLSNLNLDRGWVGRDMVGIDAGAAVLALDNYLMGNRVRETFHHLSCVQRGLDNLGVRPVAEPAAVDDQVRQAS